ncbi:unnamed protein product, partial [Candidula unifasciata]
GKNIFHSWIGDSHRHCGWSCRPCVGNSQIFTIWTVKRGQTEKYFRVFPVSRSYQTFSHDQKLTTSVSRLPRKLRDGVESCCAGDVDQMAVIIEFIRQKQTNVPVPVTYDPANVTSGPVSVHKRLLPLTRAGMSGTFTNDSNIRLQPDNSESDTTREHVNNVQVLPSGFLILLSGYYHIYSSLEFTSRDSRPCREFAVKTWKQIVLRSRPNDRISSGAILSSAHTCCDHCTWDKETSYTAGTFYLQAGDHLHVEASGTGLVSFHTESTYFGLTMISNRSQMLRADDHHQVVTAQNSSRSAPSDPIQLNLSAQNGRPPAKASHKALTYSSRLQS